MPKRRSGSPLPFGDFEDDFDDDTGSDGSKTNPPVQRNAANARERARMRVLSGAFCRLKTKLPWVPADTKLSKLDTLRLATIYIQQLRTSLMPPVSTSASNSDESDAVDNSAHNRLDAAAPNGSKVANALKGSSLVWPFSFPNLIDSTNSAASSTTVAAAARSGVVAATGNVTGLTHWLSSTRLHVTATAADTSTAAASVGDGSLMGGDGSREHRNHQDHQQQHQQYHPHHHQQPYGHQNVASVGRNGYTMLGNTTAQG